MPRRQSQESKSLSSESSDLEASRMAQHEKVPNAKPDTLSIIPGTHMMK